MRVGNSIEELVDGNYSVIEFGKNLAECVGKLEDKSICLVSDNGRVIGITGKNEILEGFLEARESLNEIKIYRHVGLASSNIDLKELLNNISQNVKFILVIKNNKILGVLTKEQLKNLSF